MIDIITLERAKAYADMLASGIKSIVSDGSQLIFTLANDSVVYVPISRLSNDFSDEEKNKLDSLDGSVLSKFTYVSGQLLFDGQPIETSWSIFNL